MQSKITLKDVILELTPFPQQLIDWCKSHPDFSDALKNVYPEKFISAGVIIEHPPIRVGEYAGDVVIGVYTYHHEIKKPVFKQDFIVYNGRDYILYSRNPAGNKKYVKDINEFYKKYGQYGHVESDHHLTLEELPIELQRRGRQAIDLAERMNLGSSQEIPQELIDKTYKEVMLIPRKDRIVKVKLS
jgi:hypothetical protein